MVAILINSAAIIVGTLIGLIFRKFIKDEITKSILKALGIVVLVISLMGIIKSMIYIDDDGFLTSRLDLFLILVIVIGMYIGEILKIDNNLQKFSRYLEEKIKFKQIGEAFLTASFLFVIGSMAIVGSVNAAFGDYKLLILKASLDGITSIILASTLGFGVIFSSISVLIFQGSITFFVGIFSTGIDQDFILSFSLIGYVILASVGLNFILKEKIKTANMLPSLVLVIIYHLVLLII